MRCASSRTGAAEQLNGPTEQPTKGREGIGSPCTVLRGGAVAYLRAAKWRPYFFVSGSALYAEPLGVAMSLICPICKSPAQELPHAGHATGFECPTQGKFKVADTATASNGKPR